MKIIRDPPRKSLASKSVSPKGDRENVSKGSARVTEQMRGAKSVTNLPERLQYRITRTSNKVAECILKWWHYVRASK